METRLTTIPFPKHGRIYFKDDLRALTGRCEGIDVDTSDTGLLGRFSIGPLISVELWEGSRGKMRLDRGPCKFHPPCRKHFFQLGKKAIAAELHC